MRQAETRDIYRRWLGAADRAAALRRSSAGLVALALLLLAPAALASERVGATAAQSDCAANVPMPSNVVLVMAEEPGCPHCIRWMREIGPLYPKTPEGRFAPLKRVTAGDPVLRQLKPVQYSPTFIVVKNGVEVGRVIGYPGQDFFWSMLDQELDKAGFSAWASHETGQPVACRS